MATIAIGLRVDYVAAQSHQIPVSASQIQGDGCYLETSVRERAGTEKAAGRCSSEYNAAAGIPKRKSWLTCLGAL